MNKPDMAAWEPLGNLAENKPQTDHCMAYWSEPKPEPELTPQLKAEIFEWLQELGIAPQSKSVNGE